MITDQAVGQSLPLFAIFEETNVKNDNMTENNLLSLSHGNIVPKNIDTVGGLLPASFETYQIVTPGQIVLRLTDMQNDQKSLRSGLVRDKGIITSAYCALQSHGWDSPWDRYFSYYFHALDVSKYLYSLGGGVRQSLKYADIKHVKILVPSVENRDKIILFLDEETAKIDHLIAKQRELISLLEERLSAFMENALVKGISHDNASPIEWRRVKHLFKLRDERNHLEREEVTLLSLYAKHGVRKYDEIEERTGNPVRTVQDYKCIHAGDIIVNIILAWMGSIGRSPHNGVISPAYDIWTPLEGVSSRYYHYLFRTKWFSGECYKRGKGIMMMRWRTYADQFGDIRVPFPSQQEQDYLVNLIEREESQVQNLISKCQRMIDLLQERRSALITAAVTGQIEV